MCMTQQTLFCYDKSLPVRRKTSIPILSFFFVNGCFLHTNGWYNITKFIANLETNNISDTLKKYISQFQLIIRLLSSHFLLPYYLKWKTTPKKIISFIYNFFYLFIFI